MAHGGSKSRSVGGRRWMAIVLLACLIVALTSVGGPADNIPSLPRVTRSTPKKTPTPSVTLVSRSTPAAELLRVLPPVTPSIASPSAAEKKPRVLTLQVTAYCACKKCCGSRAQGLTATGKPITYNGGYFVAADKRVLPYGTKLSVPGYNDGKPVEVIDRGGAIKGYHIDIFMPSHQQAVEWGKKYLQVTIVEEQG